MAKKIYSEILFYNKSVGEIFSIEPFSKVEYKFIDDKYKSLSPKSYRVFIEGVTETITPKMPKEYIEYLHMALSGSYVRATEMRIDNAERD